MEYVISVSKTYSNSAKKRNSKTKKRSFRYYFYDEAGHLRRKTISRTQAYFMKLFVKKYKVPKREKAKPFAITFSQLLIPPFSCAIPFFRFCLNLNLVQMNPIIKNSITKINPSIPVTRYIRFPINIEITVPLKSNIFNFSIIVDVRITIVMNIITTVY